MKGLSLWQFKRCATVQEGNRSQKLEFFGHDRMKECGVDKKLTRKLVGSATSEQKVQQLCVFYITKDFRFANFVRGTEKC